MATKKNTLTKTSSMFDSEKAVTLLVLLIALATVGYFWSLTLKNKAVAYVNGDIVTMDVYQRNFDGMKKYREGQGEKFSSEDSIKKLREEIIDTLLANAVVIQQANLNDISVSQIDIDNEYKKIVDANTNGDENKFKDQINNLYGFSVEEYKFYFVRISLYEKMLQEKITKEDAYKKDAKEKIDKANNEITNGMDFSLAVAKYSDDEVSKASNGDMGWIGRGQTVKGFEDVVFSLEKGSISKVIEDVDGFHIILATDKKNEEIRVSQILASVQSFEKWIDDKVSEASIKVLI